MNAEQYARWTAPLRKRPGLVRVISLTNKALTGLGYVMYPLLLILLASTGAWEQLLRAIAGPGLGFLLVTVARRRFNKPRPYEALDIEPLLTKSTEGKSFPSRHAFSMFAIAAAWLLFFPPAGAFLLVAGVAMGALRVLCGFHYPVDVLAGAALGLIAGFL